MTTDFRVETAATSIASASGLSAGPAVATAETAAWRRTLPVLAGARVTLRDLRVDDAPALLAMIATDEVARFISPPPSTRDGFVRFIEWTRRERVNGNYICFAIVPAGMSTAVGLFQIRALEPGFATAEWGFAIGSEFWGTGLFTDGAKMLLDFAFGTVGTYRLEARAAVTNGRGNGALRKLGASPECVLRRSFLRNGRYYDQMLWSIIAEDWQYQRRSHSIHVH